MKKYSPFLNEKREFLSIDEVTYAELNQLSILDEGYHLEYKLNFSDSVKKKIPDIMTSFANSGGGWIIIGIDDKLKSIFPIKRERNDFGQIISQLLKGCVTPIPRYEVRFLECPDNTNNGVLLIYVHEGDFTPYISNGTVFIRNGSSKEPLHRADRATIELLLDKSNQHKKNIEYFFKREIEFPYNNLLSKRREYSLCNIYLKNLSKINIFKTYQDKENIRDYFFKQSIFHYAQFDINSILFRQGAITPFENKMTLLYELHKDASAKIHIPLTVIDEADKEDAASKICECISSTIDENATYKIIDGGYAISAILTTLLRHIDILKRNNIPISDLVLQLECEDIENIILYFDCPLYFQYIKNNGLCFSQRQIEKTEIIYLKDCEGLEYDQLSQAIALDLFAYIFGYHPDKAYEMYRMDKRLKHTNVPKDDSV